jgi:hypothetical protein
MSTINADTWDLLCEFLKRHPDAKAEFADEGDSRGTRRVLYFRASATVGKAAGFVLPAAKVASERRELESLDHPEAQSLHEIEAKDSDDAGAIQGVKDLDDAGATQGAKDSDDAGAIQGVKDADDAVATQGAKDSDDAGATQGAKDSDDAGAIQGAKDADDAGAIQGAKDSDDAGAIQGDKDSDDAGAIQGDDESTDARKEEGASELILEEDAVDSEDFGDRVKGVGCASESEVLRIEFGEPKSSDVSAGHYATLIGGWAAMAWVFLSVLMHS